MERDPAWSPDGKWIAYFSDESGEYELARARLARASSRRKKIRLEERPTFYMAPRWSPDSQKIAFIDAHLNTWYVDVDQKKAIRVDKDRFWGSNADRVPTWSPDSKWLAYGKRLENYLGAIFVYSLADAKSTQLTDGLSDARYPVFDKDGKYLYFTASTDSGPSLEADIRSASRTVSRSVYLAVLSKSESVAVRAGERRGEARRCAAPRGCEGRGAGTRESEPDTTPPTRPSPMHRVPRALPT